MQTVHNAGIKIALEGQGADELFGGYPPHFSIAAFDALRNGAAADFRANMRSTAHSSFANKKNALLLPPKVLLARWFSGSYATAFRQKNAEYGLLRNDFWQQNTDRLQFLTDEHPLQLNALLHRQFTGTTLKFLLRAGDRNAMRHSIETRMPFTDDHELVEFVMQLPAAFKIRNGISKHLLREATKNILPPPIYSRTDKIGFGTPELDWLRHNSPQLLAYITDDMNEFIDVTALRKAWNGLLQNAVQGNTHRLWRIVNFAIWRKVFGA
jgi:asparagine synthase (glutamine-hydrolysing)